MPTAMKRNAMRALTMRRRTDCTLLMCGGAVGSTRYPWNALGGERRRRERKDEKEGRRRENEKKKKKKKKCEDAKRGGEKRGGEGRWK